jgi:hypothetical protein
MQRKMNEGGALIWIAPSGGRDRPKADGKWSPDPFDAAAVDLMRNLAQVGGALGVARQLGEDASGARRWREVGEAVTPPAARV